MSPPAKGSFGSPARGGFGGFSTTSTRLSYLAEPPNFAAISDANVVVSLKNLLKKDNTTKAKALEEIVSYVQSHPHEAGGTEDAVLEAWVLLYPRLSVDNSRRVRELSHVLQLELLKSSRKRMERHIPKIAGAWLAGASDRDRVVSRAASEGLSSFLNTEDKVSQFWKKLHVQILDYAVEAIQETPDTLSDERSTSKEDADAKYYRVCGGSLSLVLGLLNRVEIELYREALDQFFAVDAVWSMAVAEDSFTRKTVYQLLQACLEKQPDLLKPHLQRLAKTVLSDGLKSSQAGSSAEFVNVLLNLTKHYPEIWGTKKPPLSRLQVFLERGSQGASSAFWHSLEQLLLALPQTSISSSGASDVLRAIRAGLSTREELRTNLPFAWTCYLNTLKHLLSLVSSQDREKLLEENFYPLTEQYLHPTPDKASWSSGAQLKALARSWRLFTSPDVEAEKSAVAEWKKLADGLISRMLNSLPEVSKDYQKSQEAVVAEGDRWYALVGAIHSAAAKEDSVTEEMTRDPSAKIIASALDLLERRNYKPFGAAAVLSSALRQAQSLFHNTDYGIFSTVFAANDKLLDKLKSLSAPSLLACLNALGDIPSQAELYRSTWELVINLSLTHANELALSTVTTLISTPSGARAAQQLPALQQYILANCAHTAQGPSSAEGWQLFEVAFASDVLTESSAKEVLKLIIDNTTKNDTKLSSTPSSTDAELRALEIILQWNTSLLQHDEDLRLAVVTKLLSLSELSDNSISTKASSLRAVLESGTSGQELPVANIIQRNLEDAGAASLEVDTLVQQALKFSGTISSSVEDLFPSTNVWMSELLPLLVQTPDPSLSLMSSLGGAYFLVRGEKTAISQSKRDKRGYSIPVRMALYTAEVFSSDIDTSSLPPKFKAELLYLLYLVVELAADQLVSGTKNGLWLDLSQGNAQDMAEEFVSSARKSIHTAVTASGDWSSGSLADDLIEIMRQQTKDLSPLALYSAKALSDLLQVLAEASGQAFSSAAESKFFNLGVMKATESTVLLAAGVLTGLGETLSLSKPTNTLCNRLVSDITGGGVESPATFHRLVLLNACLSSVYEDAAPVESRRLIFAVKQITSWTEKADFIDPGLAAECCKALQRMLPALSEVYGPYWEQTIQFCIHLWKNASQDPVDLPYVHASLKLAAALESIQDPNDDLVDALQAHAEERSLALLSLLKVPRDARPTQTGQIVDALLCRRVEKLPLDHVADISELYGLVASDSRDIQTAAFSLLHRAMPAVQEKLSVDVLLEKKDARLPDELLSLLLDPPTLEAYPDDLLVHFPTPVRSYLLSWHLIYDAFNAASFKVRGDYVESLKTANVMNPLLEFMFDVLGHSAAHALNLDKEGFTSEHIHSYDIKVADSDPEERSMQWLLINLFYLTLKHAPGLFKAWYLDCRSKQTKLAVEAWTTKFFSPIVISETLDEVSEWASSQEPPEEDEKELLVRVSRNAREVIAGYEVDEDNAAIAIRIPPNYPIESVSVVSINRVAVSEKKWQNWLLNTQGVITFSNGSIIDGLSAFRRNVIGALKGQSECAICYSIISADKKMPDKRCQTCKNLFHRTCLYKWFQTSNQNTCPLCRNPIDYLGSSTKRS